MMNRHVNAEGTDIFAERRNHTLKVECRQKN